MGGYFAVSTLLFYFSCDLHQSKKVRIKTESLRKYFPRNYSAQQMEREIIKLLEARYRAKGRGER